MNVVEQANAFCSNETKKSGTNFYYSFLFLSKEQKQDIVNVYTFCKMLDDCVDEISDKAIATRKLNFYYLELENIEQHKPTTHPVTTALAVTIKRYNIPLLYFYSLFAGMEMDLKYQGYETFADLDLYCHNVASTVGMICSFIFGSHDDSSLLFARKLGIALQYINIIRDVGEDLQKNRVYLPLELLQKYNLTFADFDNINNIPRESIRLALAEMAALAKQHRQEALAELAKSAYKKHTASLIMAEIYFCLLKKIQKKNFPLDKRVTILPITKLLAAFRILRQV